MIWIDITSVQIMTLDKMRSREIIGINQDKNRE